MNIEQLQSIIGKFFLESLGKSTDVDQEPKQNKEENEPKKIEIDEDINYKDLYTQSLEQIEELKKLTHRKVEVQETETEPSYENLLETSIEKGEF